MKQGVLQNHRVRLLLSAGHSCYRPRRKGERVRKSVRGCIVGPDIAVLALAIVKQGDADIPGLTDQVLPKRLGPKRATKVCPTNHLFEVFSYATRYNLLIPLTPSIDQKILQPNQG